MKYILGFALLIASWLQPLHLLPWVSWHSEVLAFAAILWFFLIEMLNQKTRKHPLFILPIAAITPFVMVLLVLIQYGFGLIYFFGDALVICFYMAICSLAIIIGHAWGARNLFAEKTQNSMPLLGQLAITVLAGGIISILIALIQAFNVWDSAEWIVRLPRFRRPGANFGQPNHFATLILMGIASLAFLFKLKLVSVRLATSTLIFLIFGLAISESRTGLLGAIGLTIWWFLKRRHISINGTIVPVVTGWASLLLFLWAWPIFITYTYFGIAGDALQSAGIDTTAGMRLIVWPQLIEAVMQRPWYGWGLREVSEAHNAVLHHYRQGEPFTYSHNVILDLAVGIGLPLTALLVGLVVHWMWHRLKAANSLASWYCIAIAIPLTIHSMLEFPFAYAYFLVPVMLAVGVLEANAAPLSILRWRFNLTIAGAVSLYLVMIWSAVEYVAIEEDFRIARFEALHVGQTPIQYKRPNTQLLTQLDALLTATRTIPSPEMSKLQVELLRSAAMRFPWTATQNRYALSLALNGNTHEALRQLEVIRAMHGEKTYEGIKANWKALAQEKYPQLRELALP